MVCYEFGCRSAPQLRGRKDIRMISDAGTSDPICEIPLKKPVEKTTSNGERTDMMDLIS